MIKILFVHCVNVVWIIAIGMLLILPVKPLQELQIIVNNTMIKIQYVLYVQLVFIYLILTVVLNIAIGILLIMHASP